MKTNEIHHSGGFKHIVFIFPESTKNLFGLKDPIFYQHVFFSDVIYFFTSVGIHQLDS